MGAVFGKLCCCCYKKNNTIGAAPEENPKVILLGLTASGKTELGYLVSRQQRRDYEPTNGVKYFRMELPADRYLSITEVGGNAEMQKIWHHYFLTAMGIIYCFDMSESCEELQKSFDCFQRTLRHPYMRGKPILLVATKADLADEGVQLYDIENTFQLDAITKFYSSSAHTCYAGRGLSMESVSQGISWLIKYLTENMDSLQVRLKIDANTKAWQDHVRKLITEGRLKRSRYRQFQYHLKNTSRRKLWYRSFGHFRTKSARPRTAPSAINTAMLGRLSITDGAASMMPLEENAIDVPNLNGSAGESGSLEEKNTK